MHVVTAMRARATAMKTQYPPNGPTMSECWVVESERDGGWRSAIPAEEYMIMKNMMLVEL